MTQKWQIVLLSAVISCGSGLNAMDKQEEQKNPLSYSVEQSKAIIIKGVVNKLNCSDEFRKQEQLSKEAKEALKNSYFKHCGGNTPPEPLFSSKNGIHYSMMPYPPHWY
jgi:hypothetical protein